jgi:hypothetical protein
MAGAAVARDAVAAIEQFGFHLGGARGTDLDRANGALAHVLDDVGLGQRPTKGFAGEPYLLGGLGFGFAFAGRQEVDGAAHPVANFVRTCANYAIA